MQHHIYNTRGFVLGSEPQGESSRYVYIFTQDLGLVGVHVQNVRAVNSKLRQSLQDYSVSRISLVRGKTLWRLTNASLEQNFYLDFKNNKPALLACAQISALLKKLLAGEDKNTELFELVVHGLNILLQNSTSQDRVSGIEVLVVLNILYNLGYVAPDTKVSNFLKSPSEYEVLLSEAIAFRKDLAEYVNKSIKISGL